MKTSALKTMFLALILACSAVTATQAAPNVETTSCAPGATPAAWIQAQGDTGIPALAGGNTGACKRSCDNALERCMQSGGKARPHCQEDWRWCSRGCERS